MTGRARVFACGLDETSVREVSSWARIRATVDALPFGETQIARIADEATMADAIVLGPRVVAPLEVARRIQRTIRDLPIVVLESVERVGPLRDSVMITPGLSRFLICRSAEEIEGLEAEIDDLIVRGRRHRVHEARLDSANRQLTELRPPGSRASFYLDQLLFHAPIGVLIADVERQLGAVNEMARRILSLEEGTLPALLEEAFPSVHRSEIALLHNEARERQSPAGPIRIQQEESGSVRVFEVTLAPLGEPHPGSMVLLRDVTDRHRLDENIREAHTMTAVGRLAGGIGHEFNNLLTGIIGHAQMIADSAPDRDDIVADAKEVRRAAERAATLTGQLLSIARRQMLRPELTSLRKLILEWEPAVRATLGEHIQLIVRCEAELGYSRLDSSRIKNAILQLVLNAQDAMPDGGTLRISARNRDFGPDATEGPEGEYVEIEIEDTGIGMDEETLARSFDPFFTTRPFEGTGLGLSAARGIVSQSEGYLLAESQPGEGARFRILLPRLAPPPQEPAPSSFSAQAPRYKTILLVEDDTMVRNLGRRILEQAGWRVHAAGSGAEALRILGHLSEGVSLVLTDVVMPGMSGPELVREIRSLYGEIPVLYATGYPAEALGLEEVDSGGVSIATKPLLPEDLLERVESMFSRNEA